MGKLKSKRYLLAMVFALAAFGATFAAVLAGVIPVQWSREQPVFLESVTLQTLPDTDMKIFEDKEQQKEIKSGDTLVFKAFQPQPPLDKVFGGGAGRNLFIRNDSAIPLNLLQGGFDIEIAPGGESAVPRRPKQLLQSHQPGPGAGVSHWS